MACASGWVRHLGADVVADIRGRLPHWHHDWTSASRYGIRLLAPSLYIFFASVLPALAFGEQLAGYTKSQLTVVHVLVSTALSGIVQALAGGQPLLIIGVAEPIVIIYGFLYDFAADREDLGAELFLPWAAWVCVWTALLCGAVALVGACRWVSLFTRMSGELFGMLIAVLFMQQGIKGLIEEFRPVPEYKASQGGASGAADLLAWRLVNGLWALLLAAGLLATCMLVRQARSWPWVNGVARGLLEDYGVPLLVVVWSGLSFAVSTTNVTTAGGPADASPFAAMPSGIPRRITTPHVWEVKDTWRVASRMADVPGTYVAAALLPAVIITVLFWFDHGVSSQMAQQKEFGLVKPPAYAWDMALLGLLTLTQGLLGLPPTNGVLPQAPMHTRALRGLHREHQAADGGPHVKASETGDIQKLSADGQAADQNGVVPPTGQPCSGEAVQLEVSVARCDAPAPPGQLPQDGDPPQALSPNSETSLALPDPFPPVAEQRVTNLLQAMLVGGCLFATHAVRQVPTAVVWGYFAFMALESLPGSQLWARLQLLVTDPLKRTQRLEQEGLSHLAVIPFAVTAAFTAFQFSWLAGVWALTTWAGVAGVAFPIAIVALIPVRAYLLPRLLRPDHLEALDGDGEEGAAATSDHSPSPVGETVVDDATDEGDAPSPGHGGG